MTLEEAKKILERHGRSTCSCKYGPKKKYVGLRVTDYGFDVDVYTTIPSEITKQDYWNSEYANNDFSYMMAYHFPKLLKYFGINSYLPTDVNVYNVDGKLIGKF